LNHNNNNNNYSFNDHFPGKFSGKPGEASTKMFLFCIILELTMMKVAVTTGATRPSKLQSNHHRQQTNTQLFTGRMPFLSPNQQCQNIEGKISFHSRASFKKFSLGDIIQL